MINKILFLSIYLLFIACSNLPNYDIDNWVKLIDPNFNQEQVVNFYKNKIKKVKEGSIEESKIYEELQKELKKAGNDKNMDNK